MLFNNNKKKSINCFMSRLWFKNHNNVLITLMLFHMNPFYLFILLGFFNQFSKSYNSRKNAWILKLFEASRIDVTILI